MASKAKMRRVADRGHLSGGVEQRDRSLQAASNQEIRRRAYEIYLERGAEPGHELEDWLQAEREFKASPSNSPDE